MLHPSKTKWDVALSKEDRNDPLFLVKCERHLVHDILRIHGFRGQNDQDSRRRSQGFFNCPIPVIPWGNVELINPQIYFRGSQVLRQADHKILVGSSIAEKQSFHLPASFNKRSTGAPLEREIQQGTRVFDTLRAS